MTAIMAGYINIIKNNTWFIKNYSGKKQYQSMIQALVKQNMELERLIELEAEAMINPEIEIKSFNKIEPSENDILAEAEKTDWNKIVECDSCGWKGKLLETRMEQSPNGSRCDICDECGNEIYH